MPSPVPDPSLAPRSGIVGNRPPGRFFFGARLNLVMNPVGFGPSRASTLGHLPRCCLERLRIERCK